MNPQSEQTHHWDQRQTAKYLGLSPRTLENWRFRGGGPRYRKFGKKILYDPTEVKAWAERQARQSTSDTGKVA